MGRLRKDLVLRRPAQVAALGSPVRSRIVDVLAGQGPCSLEELSVALGRHREALSYHVRALRRHGLVVLHSRRKGRRRPEAVYAVAAPRLLLDRTQRSRPYLDAVAKAGEARLRASARDYRAALAAVDLLAEYSPATLSVRRLVGSLDQQGLLHLSDLLNQIDALFHKYEARHDKPLQSLTIALVPVGRRKRMPTRAAAGADRRRRAP
jgi:DNA-binding transcriptional ArsR family regulator